MQIAQANDQMRDWSLTSGKNMQGEIMAYDEVNKIVSLRLANQSEVKLKEQDFSTIDRAWILQWVEQDEEARRLLAKLGGKVTEYTGIGKVKIDYAVYQPPNAAAGAEPPLLILFHPGGNGRRQIYRYIEAASAVGITVVSLDYFRNSTDSTVYDEMLAAFKELLPQIEATVPHDKKRMFMGGVSGAAARSYHYSALVDRPWAGIFANGGWLGGSENYTLPFPRMRVAMVCGDKDEGPKSYIEPDSACLQKAGCIVSVHAFEGGHQLAPPVVQVKALRWLLGQEAPAEFSQ